MRHGEIALRRDVDRGKSDSEISGSGSRLLADLVFFVSELPESFLAQSNGYFKTSSIIKGEENIDLIQLLIHFSEYLTIIKMNAYPMIDRMRQ